MMMSQTLAEAFSENPLFNYMLRQDHRKKRAYQELFNTAIGVMKKNNEMYVTEKIEGVALWNPPNKWGLTWLQEIYYLPRFLHISGIARINRLNKVMDMMKRKRPSLPHMYHHHLC